MNQIRKECYQFANVLYKKNSDFWNKVAWCDENKLNTYSADDRILV